LLTDDERKDIETKFLNTGLHIHCPDGSTPKDGPSAGTAITTAIYSLLTNKPIKNDLAITGEIDLDGNVTAIGGLDAKLSGAKRAGIKLALVPEENKRDVEILLNKNKSLIDNKFKVKFISHIDEVLKIAFKNK
jgi:ATP-dependent Lon protease